MSSRSEITKEIARLFPKIISGVQSPLLHEGNLSMSQLVLLMTLHEVETASISEIARARKVSLPTITGMVERLIQAGQVERVEDPADRRRVLVRLTEKGKKTVRTVIAAIKRRWIVILCDIPKADQMVFLQTIRRILDLLEGENASGVRGGKKPEGRRGGAK